MLGVVLACLAAGCGGGGSQGARSVEAILDDVIRAFPQGTIDDIARGGGVELDNVFRANSSIVDDALRTAEFESAVTGASRVAEAQLTSRVGALVDDLDEFAQRKVEDHLRKMVCEARLYARNQQGDIQILRPWIEQELAQIAPQLTGDGHREIAEWLAEKVNDKTSVYSLACIAWNRAGR